MRISVLDQSHIPKGKTAGEAIQYTVELAKLADKLGFHRFWVSEHHNMAPVAGSTPEVLLAYLAGHTKHIRLGSGGVMLPHYSALKVAENFRMLEALAPGRVDLGVGRAPGGDRLTAGLLNPNNTFNEQEFIEQLSDLQNYLNNSHEPGSFQARVTVTPVTAGVPELWVLSSSGQSGLFAAHFGMAFSFAHFINPNGGPEAVKRYKASFKPSENQQEPQANVAVFTFCSEDKEKVKQIQAVAEYRFLQLETRGRFVAVSYDEIKDTTYSPAELERLNRIRQRFIIGTPEQVKAKFTQMAQEYDIDEVMAVNIAPELEDRISCYRLLAKAFELSETQD
ncbi:LLM class flavin-dependent oxidoreductase [Pontibacter silvestris]|uniref:LLM class flavin-dependent oxidoreductase n=1 Tax=Pontibacter silvestris TaxID=2305183 RepID=A0ABW4X0E6_9BACT|nr:LLM class flavin-dependent oxidoreductase [Pontibacter silvestris]MCC9136034.1 LLM class flavin-dependent oxidoreductase [Pontibacter silvestris]